MENKKEQLAKQLGEQLLKRGMTVTCAESCTGGGIASAITSVAGSSHWFSGSLVTYSNELKEQLLGVAAETLAVDGAVSEAAVRQMATGALRVANADIAVAVSGVAGPDGGTVDKPIGTVWFCWANRAGALTVQRHHFSGDRAAVRDAAVLKGLLGLKALLKNTTV